MDSFEALCARIRSRQRFLQGLEAMSWTALGTVGLTALVVVLSALRAVPMPPVLGLVGGNILLAAVAFGVGWFRRFNTIEMLWRADRNARCNEHLVTVYELKSGRGDPEFLPLLERRLEGLALDVAQALPLESSERRRWAGVLALALLCLTPFTVKEIFTPAPDEQPTATAPSTSSPLPQQPPREISELMQTPPPALAQKIPAWRQRLEQARTALAQNPNDPRARALLEQLHAEISQAQDRLRNVPGSDTEPPRSDKPDEKASLVENPSGEIRPPSDSPKEPSSLDRLLQDLQGLQGQVQGLSPEEMQHLLEQLRQGNPDAASIVQQILQTSQNDQEFREKLGEILKNLQERQSLNEQLEQLKQEAQSALSQSQPQTAPSPSATSSGDSSPSPKDDQNAPESAESIEGPKQENAVSKPSGGRGTAPLDPEAVKDLPDLSALRERTRSFSVPGPQDENLQILFEIVSMGLPQSTGTSGSTSPAHIDYQKVETLLDTLEIPAQLRDAVRRYFLSLAKEGAP